MNIYLILHGNPDMDGIVRRYEILFSTTSIDRASDMIDELANHPMFEKIESDKYRHKQDGSHVYLVRHLLHY